MAEPSNTAVAHHEAGHAVAAVVTGRELEYATVQPDQEFGFLGHVAHSAPVGSGSSQVIVALAGILAGRRHMEQQTPGMDSMTYQFALEDYDESCNHDVVTIEDALPHGEVAGHSDASELANLTRETNELLDRHWDAVTVVARTLLEQGHLTGQEVAALCGRGAHRG